MRKSNLKGLPWYKRFAYTVTRWEWHKIIWDRTGIDPYLVRYTIIPRWATLGLFHVCIHQFMRSDQPEDGVHDHPWPYLSIILESGYVETSLNKRGQEVLRRYHPGAVLLRSACHKHRIELVNTPTGREIPCWTLFIMGPKLRNWGFWLVSPRGRKFVPWKQHLNIREKVCRHGR